MSRGGQEPSVEPIREWKKLEQNSLLDTTEPILMPREKAIFAVEFLLALGVYFQYEGRWKDLNSELDKIGLSHFDQTKIHVLVERLIDHQHWDIRSLGISPANIFCADLRKLLAQLKSMEESTVNAPELIGHVVKFTRERWVSFYNFLGWINKDSIKPEDVQYPAKPPQPSPKKPWGYD